MCKHNAEIDAPARVGDTAVVYGVVRSVEALVPAGHYRITLDVNLARTRVSGEVETAWWPTHLADVLRVDPPEGTEA